MNVALFDVPKHDFDFFGLKDTIQQHRLFQNWLELFLRNRSLSVMNLAPFLDLGKFCFSKSHQVVDLIVRQAKII